MNKATGKAKGTAFVQFEDGAAAQKACAACARQRDGGGEGVTLRGKVLGIDAALVQDSARALAQSKGGAKGGDRRNLHLVRCLGYSLVTPRLLCCRGTLLHPPQSSESRHQPDAPTSLG